MWRDMERLCEKHEVPFRRPSQFPRNGVRAARVALAAEAEAWVGRFIRSVYLANFRDDLDITDAALVRDLLASAGCTSPDHLLERAELPESKLVLRARTEDAIRLGIFGAPTFVVGKELFWGHDRMEDAIAWCVKG